jgi:hypothetical protein
MNLYHGSPVHGLTEFSIENPRFEPVEGSGVYLTQDYRVARRFAGSEGCVYVCKLKSDCVFDATSKNEFKTLLQKISKKIGFNLFSLEHIDQTITGLVSGQYQITGHSSSGFSWQIGDLLSNNSSFLSIENNDEKLELVKNEIDDYLNQHPILKYNDKNLGLVYLCRDPQILKISETIDVGSDAELELL